MLERLVRSPLFAIFTMLWVTTSAILALTNIDINKLWFTPGTVYFILWIVWIVLEGKFERKNPAKSNIRKLWMPREFKELDEGQQWVTYKACRNVYIFFSVGIPFGIFACVCTIYSPFVPIVVLFLLGAGQLLTYWITTRKYSAK
ncbi:hypothetical protein [Paenibacillus sp. sgz500958]|uniref:hypothetical protein n=1 Tax=Paenibacillus sp. sgz500958 TaxID=3242475 RepID=UPI0036D28D97